MSKLIEWYTETSFILLYRIFLKRRTIHTYCILINDVHTEVLQEKDINVCNLLGNALKIRWVDGCVEEYMNGYITGEVSVITC